jgi:aspartate/methionine/tyrosine aminotransferase
VVLSDRVPSDAAPNPWARRLAEMRAAGRELIDLTDANPTRTGLSLLGEPEGRALETAHRAALQAAYEPDPRGLRSARVAVAGYYAARGVAVDPAHLVLTTGTSESYAHLFRLLANPGDTVLAPAPSYPLFEPLAALEGVRLASYALAWDGCWHLELDSLERGLAAGARAVVLVEPNHPTGTCLEDREREALENLCARYGAAIIVDEVFGDFAWGAGDREATARAGVGFPSWAGERGPRRFVLSGLSKICGLPQMKLGWILAGGPPADRDRALASLEWIADLFLSVPSAVQVALPALLETRRAFQARTLDRIAANRARLAVLASRRPELSVLGADGGWVACVRLPSRRSEEEWALALLECGVIVHPGHFYDFAFGPIVVLSLITTSQAFEQGLERLDGLLAEP